MSTLGRGGRSCLLVIDLQEAVVADCLDRDGVLHRTARLVDRARAAGTPIVHIQHDGPGLERGSDGWQLAAPLRYPGQSFAVATHDTVTLT